MKKVYMILTNRFDPDVRVYKEAKYLVSEGFDVEILCWDREGDYIEKEYEILDGIKIKRFFPFAKYGTGLKQIISYYKFILECKRYLSNKDYEYIHCHDLDGVIAGYLASNKKSKLIFDMHEFYEGQDRKKNIKYLIKKLVDFMQSKSYKIIYVNDIQIRNIKQKNLEKVVYLPNYPDLDNFPNLDKKKSNKLRVSYIGAVRQYNELKMLMDACKDMNDVQIEIHGAGTAYDKLKSLEDKYCNVKVTGTYHFAESAKLYSNADIIYAMYSKEVINWRISYPIKLYESIVTKTPLIVQKETNLEKFINKYNIGFAIDGNNISEIRNLIRYIVDNPENLNQKAKNLEKIQYNYSWQEVVKNLGQIYK